MSHLVVKQVLVQEIKYLVMTYTLQSRDQKPYFQKSYLTRKPSRALNSIFKSSKLLAGSHCRIGTFKQQKVGVYFFDRTKLLGFAKLNFPLKKY